MEIFMEQIDKKILHILLVEDNPGDVRLTQEAFKDMHVNNVLHVVNDGVEALSFLQHEGIYKDVPRPDLILLDLNLPRKDGREVLREVKSNLQLRNIPIIILTTSDLEMDVANTYALHANCYITKPVDFNKFINVVKQIDEFWFHTVRLPKE